MIWRHDSEVYKPSSTSVQEHAKFHYKSQWAEHSLWKHLREIPSLWPGLPQLPKDPAPSLVDFHWLSWIILLFSSPPSLSWLILLSQQSTTHEKASNYTWERLEAPTPTLPPVDCDMELHPNELSPQHLEETTQPWLQANCSHFWFENT